MCQNGSPAQRAQMLIQQGLTDNLNTCHLGVDKTAAQRYTIRMKSLPTHSLYCNRSRDWISNGSYDECVAHAERFMSSKPWQYAFMILKIGS